MKILIAMASIHPRRGGPSTAARGLARALSHAGHEVTISAHNDGDPNAPRYERHQGVVVRRFPLSIRKAQYSRQYSRWLASNAGQFDFVLITSLFLPHTHAAARACRRTRTDYAIRPHGSLNPADLERRRTLKALYLQTIGRSLLANASFIFCTSKQESRAAARWGRVTVIPLGVDPKTVVNRPLRERYYDAAFVGRLTMKKGVEIYLEAVRQLTKKNPAARFLLAGPDDEGILGRMDPWVEELRVTGVLDVAGLITADERDHVLSQSKCFVLPSKDENFGLAVAEALALGIPVLISPGVSHAEIVEQGHAGIVTERTPTAFAEGISTLTNQSEQAFAIMSTAARRIAQDSYSWARSAALFVQAAQGV